MAQWQQSSWPPVVTASGPTMEARQALISNPGVVEVTTEEFEGKRLPPVCAMTGAQSEAWRRFRFATLPLSTWMSSGPLSFSSERSTTGYLPLTRVSDRRLALSTWLPVAIMFLALAPWIAALVINAAGGTQSSDSTTSALPGILLLLGIALLAGGGFVLLALRPLLGPQGKVKVVEIAPGRQQTIVELRRVHPAFVAAVRQMHDIRH